MIPFETVLVGARLRPAARPRARCAWWVGVLLVVALAAGQAVAAPPAKPTTVTITGTSGLVDLTLPVDSSLINDSFDRHIKITGGGEYAGFCLVPFDPTRRLRGFASAPCKARLAALGTEDGLTLSSYPVFDAALPAGRYRLYLFADRPARVTMPLPGLKRSLVLRAAGAPPRVHLSLTRSGPSPDVIREKQSTVFSNAGVAWVGWQRRGVTPAAAFANDMCVVPAGELCAGPWTTADDAYGFTGSGAFGAGPVTTYTVSGPDGNRFLRGPVDVFMTRAATDITTRLAFTLRVDFSPGPPAR